MQMVIKVLKSVPLMERSLRTKADEWQYESNSRFRHSVVKVGRAIAEHC